MYTDSCSKFYEPPRERLAVLHTLNHFCKRPRKIVLDEDFTLRRIFKLRNVPPLSVKVCTFLCSLHVSSDVQYNETSAFLTEDFVALLVCIAKVSV